MTAGEGEDNVTLPHSIRRCFTRSSPLFLGYRLEDIRFIIIFKIFLKLMSKHQGKGRAFQVHFPNIDIIDKKEAVKNYLDKLANNYFDIEIYWNDPELFLQQLRERWENSRRTV